jgi:hypothetical protein
MRLTFAFTLALAFPAMTSAQSSIRDIAPSVDIGRPQTIPALSGPPIPDRACIFFAENFIGQKNCVQTTSGIVPSAALSMPGFIIPYGYEFKFFTKDKGPNVRPNPYDELCVLRHTDTSRAYAGLSAPAACSRWGDAYSFQKIPEITDQQRRAVWRGWAGNDLDFCAFKMGYATANPDADYTTQFDGRPREFCLGRLNPLNNAADQLIASGDQSRLTIRSPYARIRIFSEENRQGQSRDLTCGMYLFGGGMVGKIKSIEVIEDQAPNACVATETKIDRWSLIITPRDRDDIPRILRGN